MEENIEENRTDVPEIQEEKKRELQEYKNIDSRLKEIEKEIEEGNLDMDESLKLYEEAVELGVKASKTIENNVLVDSANNNTDEETDE